MAKSKAAPTKPEPDERRRHQRVKLTLSARFMRDDGSEHVAQILDISAGGVGLECETRPEVGESIIVYIDRLGRFRGQVVRPLGQGFAVAFDYNDLREERVVSKLSQALESLKPDGSTDGTTSPEPVSGDANPLFTGSGLINHGHHAIEGPSTMAKNWAARLEAQRRDRRRHKRVALALPVRFMLLDQSEYVGTLRDISISGLFITAEAQPAADSPVIIYAGDIGRLEGTVSRREDDGFAVRLQTSNSKRDRIVEKLTLYLNPEFASDIGTRSYARIPVDESAQLTLSDGRNVACRILDMSFGGVSLVVDGTLNIGDEVIVGRMRGRVVRRHDHGVAVAFDQVQANWGSLALSLR